MTLEIARDAAARERIWKGRKAAFAAMGRVSPNYYVQDGVVPRTRLPEVLRRIRELEARSGLRIGNVFHAGDGNLHPLICYDESIPGQAEHAERSRRRSSATASRPAARSPASTASAPTRRRTCRRCSRRTISTRCSSCAARSIHRDLQSGQGLSDAAAVRRGSGPYRQHPARAGRPRGAVLMRPDRGSRRAARCGRPRGRCSPRPTRPATRRVCPRGGGTKVAAGGAGAARACGASLSTASMAPLDRSLRRRPDRHAVGAGVTLAAGQRGARPRAVNGCRSIRRPPSARPSAASSPPTTAARAATSTARRAT